ncbi:MAG: trehalose-phosphatase [Gemmatimonadota bacterium]|nr:trehalose-phosphatase [Gemmatimonadota bacterium]
MRRIPDARPEWAYFFDFDGTLVHLAPAPGEVRLDADFRHVLEQLYLFTGGAIAIVTGRSIADIDRLFPEEPYPVAGQHGFELRGSATTSDETDSTRLTAAVDELDAIVSAHDGLLLERKGHSLALHYRAAPSLGGYAHRLVRRLQRELGDDYAVQSGKRVVELRPAGHDKGRAILNFMTQEPFAGRLPIFVGDDATDESGFAAVNAAGGHSLKVGPGPTCAEFRFPNVEAVRNWLQRAVAPEASR